MRLNARPLLAATIVIALLCAGCLISGTKVFDVYIGTVTVSGGSFERVLVPLEGEEIYEDFADEIRVIDRFGWVCRVINNDQSNAVNVSVYASDDGTLNSQNLATEAIPIFIDFQVPAGGTRDITYDESLELLPESSFRELQTLIDNGNFFFYAVADGSVGMTIQDLELIITFTVGI